MRALLPLGAAMLGAMHGAGSSPVDGLPWPAILVGNLLERSSLVGWGEPGFDPGESQHRRRTWAEARKLSPTYASYADSALRWLKGYPAMLLSRTR